ncbi:HK97-gp10 family putative phage morphogenesis protein [Azospirillum sp.]|uniref:HK97-gp10 family putative phage morphogenesis protein n=1 Tax=Azospirillum sp. TaxID=34012 RepID=UPI002D57331A|nr:HK97-gp10 family putative phage morphogenesis protein [Azospirillum sp.]HYD66171.1 HK97-gp10 family putative phage morphogenesis protein [Azospirillum sp.]
MAARTKGRDRLLTKMRALPSEVRSAIKQALAEGADEITDMQRRLVPKQSGDLAKSIGSTFGKYRAENANVRGVSAFAGAGDPDLTVTIHAGDAKAYYASFVEFGTAPHVNGGKFKGTQHPGTAPQPFFFPAYRALRKRVKSRITRATNRAAKKVAGK